MWCNMPSGVGAWFYIRYLRYGHIKPEYKEQLVDAHYFFVMHFFAMPLWGVVGGIIFFDVMISSYFFHSADMCYQADGCGDANPRYIWVQGAYITGIGMVWNVIFYFYT